MARAARHSRHKAARLGLLAALATACAVIEAPPGGPPDVTPPVIVSMTPDSGAVVDGLDDPLVIQFDEVISEQSGGGLERLVMLSPRARELKVSWKRTAIRVEPRGGWQPGVIYHVSLLPGITDLRNNRMIESRVIIFSTGGEIPDTRLSGTVVNWEEAKTAPGALVEAVLLPDSLVYVAQADSIGDFEITALPRGRYLVSGTIDGNNDRRRGFREPFDSTALTLDSTANAVFWAFIQDTTGAQIRQLVRLDSTAFRIDFNKKLAPGAPDTGLVRVWALPDTTPVGIAAVWEQAVYDSIKAADTTAVADTTAEAGIGIEVTDTTGERGIERQVAGVGAGPGVTPPDTSRAARLLAQRPKLAAIWVVEIDGTLEPGGRYLVEAIARGVSGFVAESRSVLVVPAPQDST